MSLQMMNMRVLCHGNWFRDSDLDRVCLCASACVCVCGGQIGSSSNLKSSVLTPLSAHPGRHMTTYCQFVPMPPPSPNITPPIQCKHTHKTHTHTQAKTPSNCAPFGRTKLLRYCQAGFSDEALYETPLSARFQPTVMLNIYLKQNQTF